MTDLTLAKIEEVLDKKLDQKLEPIKKTLDQHTKTLDQHTKILDRHTDRLDALTLDMIHVQNKTDVLPDLHGYIKDTKEKVDEIGQRVERLETAA